MRTIRQFRDISEGTFWKHNKTGELFRVALIVTGDFSTADCTITLERRRDAATMKVSAEALENLYAETDIDSEPATRCDGCEICLFEGDGSCLDPARPKLKIGAITIEADAGPVRRRKGRPRKPQSTIPTFVK